MMLINSPDDNGWYWQRDTDWMVSQVFPTKEAAKAARKQNKLVWEQE